ncbi:MAG: class I SAM-dependent methyltransferase [Cyclonatronaceae bacterium]
MEWFEEWFDSPLYEKLYSDRDDEEAELMAELITGLINPVESPVLLDLACGRGRHSLQLAERGFRVTGLDLSERAIRIAKEKVAGITRNRPLFRTGDMRKPLDSRFNVVVNLFTSFGYFENDDDNLKVIKNVHQMLLKDGWFVQDYLNPQWVRSNLRKSESGHIDHTGFSIQRKIENGFVKKMMNFTDHRTGSTASFTERVRLCDREWFRVAYAAAGLKTCAVYGNYNGDAFDELKSPRIILFSRKTV